MAQPIALSWSGGKDAMMAFHHLDESEEWEVVSLYTTVTEETGETSMHRVPLALIEEQAKRLSVELEVIPLPEFPPNQVYEREVEQLFGRYRRRGLTNIAFGDLYLEDIRKYREEWLERCQMEAHFPLWGRNTEELALDFIDLGYGAVVVCVDGRVLDPSHLGASFDGTFLGQLPPSVDLCGENGEFHTFVYVGPLLKGEIGFVEIEQLWSDPFGHILLQPLPEEVD